MSVHPISGHLAARSPTSRGRARSSAPSTKARGARRPVAERILAFNDGRDPERLRLKYKAMAKSAFAFFRGTCHLFWEEWRGGVLDRAPLAWTCGDLHFENFGAFKGDNRLEYFDLNDFDEAGLAPCTRDPVRCAASLLLAADEAKLPAREGRALCASFLGAYGAALGDGRVRWLERDNATGVVGELLRRVQQRSRLELLERRTVLRGGRRRIVVDGAHALHATGKQTAWARRLVRAAAAPDERASFRVLDVARRIAGTGSLGLERYVVLVEGKGPPSRNLLLDVKAAQPSAMSVSLPLPPRAWPNEAERIVWVQSHMQAASPALLRSVSVEGRSYLLKELQPRVDRLAFQEIDRSYASLDGAVKAMGHLVGWAQLRASGRRGAAGADALVQWARAGSWKRALEEYATSSAQRTRADHARFRAAWKDGEFDRQVGRGADRRAS